MVWAVQLHHGGWVVSRRGLLVPQIVLFFLTHEVKTPRCWMLGRGLFSRQSLSVLRHIRYNIRVS